jgi:hypothetical protein
MNNSNRPGESDQKKIEGNYAEYAGNELFISGKRE